ncbi:MAG: CotH kinase family protein [Crocinitomicaceae bacterium]
MNFKKKLTILLTILFVILLAGFFYANKVSKKFGYNGIQDVANTYIINKRLSKTANPKRLKISISSSDFNFIVSKRDIALDRGVQINEGDNYVDCNIDFSDEKSEGEIRLKGHMTDHLQGNKWSYRIKSNRPVNGMYRFSIQHPGTRNYIYEWIYHQLLKNESVIYLNYDFVDVEINGNNLGIYALEEHFGQHVLERNNKPKGAILRWNPELYWDWRIDELQGSYIDEQYSAYSSSFVEPYDKGTVKSDSDLVSNYQTGAYLLEMFRRGEMVTSDVFDIERMARFHVIIDLVGGYHSLDWSDVKFYYNSETKKIEPVGYESFSIRKTEKIAGQRVPKKYDNISFNYHDRLFSDPVFFEAYIKNMERIVSEKYLHEFMSKIQADLDEKMGIIGIEWPYRKVSFDGYFENVKLIRNNIQLPKPFHAFYASSSNSKNVNVSIAPVSDFPVQIIGVKRNDKYKALNEPLNIPAKARNTYTKYFNLSFKNPFKNDTKLTLVAKIPGSSSTFEVKINEFPAYKNTFLSDSIPYNKSLPDTSILIMNDNRWRFKSRVTKLNEPMLIPEEVTLFMYPNQILTIEDMGQLIVKGTVKFQAINFDQVIKICSKKDEGIIVMDGQFLARNVEFSGFPLIKMDNSNVRMIDCIFYDMTSLFTEVNHSDISLFRCKSGGLKSLGILNESEVNIDESSFSNGEILAQSNGTLWSIKNSSINNFNQLVNLNYGSTAKVIGCHVEINDTIAKMKNGSAFESISGDFSCQGLGFWWNTDSPIQNKRFLKLYKTKLSGIKKVSIES